MKLERFRGSQALSISPYSHVGPMPIAQRFAEEQYAEMTTPTWTIAQTKMSVLVNGAYLPFKSTPDLMQRYVRPALFSTGHKVFELRAFGTALMARYRGWDFALATAHQVDRTRGVPSEETFVVVVEHEGRKLAVPPTAVRRPRVESEELRSLADLVFFDYSRTNSDRKSAHLNLTDVFWSDDEVIAHYSFVIGYPSESAKIKLDPEDETKLTEFTLRWIRQDLQSSDPAPMDTENRLMFVKHERSTKLSTDPDGLSGSPVFSIVHDTSKERHLRFDGIVTDARNDRFAVLPSGYIRTLLESIIEEDR